MYERLRRSTLVECDPFIVHASLIYDGAGRRVLEEVYREYMDVGFDHKVPMFVMTNTVRANPERIAASSFPDRPVNQDCVRFLQEIRASYLDYAPLIKIIGSICPRGDAYKPSEALSRKVAAKFHHEQIYALAEAGVDGLQVHTLPALSEAIGIADVMAKTGLPYFLSFVVRDTGKLLDGTAHNEAIRIIDKAVEVPPFGYSINCVHPAILHNALTALERHPDQCQRIISFQANTSAKSPEELDGSPELLTENPDVLAEWMLMLHTEADIKIMGGCCGTNTQHIASLAAVLGANHK